MAVSEERDVSLRFTNRVLQVLPFLQPNVWADDFHGEIIRVRSFGIRQPQADGFRLTESLQQMRLTPPGRDPYPTGIRAGKFMAA